MADETQKDPNTQPDQLGTQQPDKSAYEKYLDPARQTKKRNKLIAIILAVIILIILAVIIVVFALQKDDGIGTDSATVTPVEVCADEACFSQHFKACTPASFETVYEGDTVRFEVTGVQDVGCRTKLQYIASADTEVAGNEEMTCDMDNELDYKTATEAATTYPDDYECSGSMLELYEDLKANAVPLGDR